MTKSSQTIPNVGPAIAKKLLRLGIEKPSDLEGADPDEVFECLCTVDDERHDPCLHDVFTAAVHYLERGENRHWSEFSERRKTAE